METSADEPAAEDEGQDAEGSPDPAASDAADVELHNVQTTGLRLHSPDLVCMNVVNLFAEPSPHVAGPVPE